jgi:hypothetical protein
MEQVQGAQECPGIPRVFSGSNQPNLTSGGQGRERKRRSNPSPPSGSTTADMDWTGDRLDTDWLDTDWLRTEFRTGFSAETEASGKLNAERTERRGFVGSWAGISRKDQDEWAVSVGLRPGQRCQGCSQIGGLGVAWPASHLPSGRNFAWFRLQHMAAQQTHPKKRP